jgi:hypothetical protein
MQTLVPLSGVKSITQFISYFSADLFLMCLCAGDKLVIRDYCARRVFAYERVAEINSHTFSVLCICLRKTESN